MHHMDVPMCEVLC